jgi:hypothetical protein
MQIDKSGRNDHPRRIQTTRIANGFEFANGNNAITLDANISALCRRS